MRKATRIAVTWFVLLLAWVVDAHAQRSFFKLYDQNQGLAAGEIAALAQDSEGFLWIGAHRGLLRFDGREFLRWAPAQLDEVVYELAYGPDDQLLVRTASGRGLLRTAGGFEAIAGPQGTPLTALASIGFDAAGHVWALIDGRVWCRDVKAHWRLVEVPGDVPQRIRVLHDEVIVFTASSVLRVRADGTVDELLHAPDVWFATGGGVRPIWLASHYGRGLWRVDAGGAHALGRPEGRVLDLRERGETMWLAMDRELLAFEPDGRARRMGIAEGIPSGGPLLVDREQGLWLGTFVGLVQFPEPDTWQWGEAEGLPLEHVYGIAALDGEVWASTWAGVAHLARAGDRFIADTHSGNGSLCITGSRGAWISDGAHLSRWQGDHFAATSVVAHSLGNCADDSAGTWWFATDAGLLQLPPASELPQRIELEGGSAPDLVWTDTDGTLHGADEHSVCRVRVLDHHHALREACHSLGAEVLNSVARLDDHRAWIAANTGVYAFDGGGAHRLPGNGLLEGGVISSLMPATEGDWWAAGAGVLARIRPCAECSAGWDTIETLGQWQGLPGNSAVKAWQAADGSVWVAGNRGVWRVPQAARVVAQQAPPVTLVHARIDGVDQPLDARPALAPSAHRLDLEFAALTFRDRGLLHFRSRLDRNAPWSKPSRDAMLQFAALEPGAYRAEMEASLDDEHWSDQPVDVAFDVLPPWYRTTASRVALAVVVFALVAWIYRLRVAALLRVERERTRIAMDLHDELGAGLGSIGVLAGVAARDGIDALERRRLAHEIANLAGLLGSGLRSLVWSLRSGGGGLAELGVQIADHARRLFPDESPRLSMQLPAAGHDEALAPELQRNVLLLALEALHNVARHGRCREVRLVLQASGAGGLVLSIDDDGCGFDPRESHAGAGLESMRRRADAIGADLRVESTRGGGTRIVLTWPAAGRTA